MALSDHVDLGGFCACCADLWPCAAVRRAFLAQRTASGGDGDDPPGDSPPR
jgi:hypothetical protein